MSGRSRLVGLCAALCVCAALVAAPRAVGAELDPSFGVGGFTQIKLSRFYDSAQAAHAARDGTVLVAADADPDRFGGFILTRLREDGTPDPAFGIGGLVIVGIGRWADHVSDVIELADGRIVLAGHAFVDRFSVREAFALARLLPDGRPDESFGAGGKVIVPGRAFDRYGECVDLSQQASMADGRIVVVGGIGCEDFKLIVMRFQADGSLDPSFHGDGRWSSRADGSASAVSVLPDGGLLIAGATGSPDFDSSGQMQLIRLTADGAYLAGWGREGRVSIRFPGYRHSHARAMALDAQGRALLVGEAGIRQPQLALARVLADGSLDQSFGQGGRLTARFHPRRENWGRAVALAPDGSAVLAVPTRHANANRYLERFVLARVTADGQLDPGFGAGGWLRVPFGSRDASAHDVVLDTLGRVVAVGSVEVRRGRNDLANRNDFVAVRLR
jgi:uncharacterized delta-60 repeat protein